MQLKLFNFQFFHLMRYNTIEIPPLFNLYGQLWGNVYNV